MPITGLPTFSAGILTASQLNAIVTALEQKFAGGINSGDISWPFTAGGNIDMAGFQLLNVGKFWNAYNVAERGDGVTLQTILTTLGTDGGGLAWLPANHTESIPAGGITIPANVILQGQGYTSVLQIDGSASAAMVRVTSVDNCAVRNLRLVGNTSVNHELLDINGADNFRAEYLTLDTHGTDPHMVVQGGSLNCAITRCKFVGNGDSEVQSTGQLYITSSNRCRIVGNQFEEWSNRVGYFSPGAAEEQANIVFSQNTLRRETVTAANMTATEAIILNPNAASSGARGYVFVGNSIGGSGAGIGGFRINGGGALSGTIIANNDIVTTLQQPAILAYNWANYTTIVNNTIACINKGDGIVIGSDTGTETASGSRTATQLYFCVVSGNQVSVDSTEEGVGVPFILAVSETTNGVRCSVTGNRFRSGYAHVMQIWNVGTTRPLHTVITGNIAFSNQTAKKGFASYSDMGATNDGDIGTAAINWYFTMVGNHIPNSVSGVDYTTGSNKTVVASNNT